MKNSKVGVKKKYIIAAVSVLLVISLIVGLIFMLRSCGELKIVQKTEYQLNFAIPEDFKRTYDVIDAEIEYTGEETAFFVDIFAYSVYELEYGASIQDCTKAILDKMEFGGVSINYDTARGVAQFDAWASDEAGSESYYNYIVVLLAQNGIYVARYVCAGTEKAIEKHSPDFAEMAKYLSVCNP